MAKICGRCGAINDNRPSAAGRDALLPGCDKILFTQATSNGRGCGGSLNGPEWVSDQGLHYDKRSLRRTGDGHLRPVPGLAGRFGGDRLPPRFVRAVPRAGRPAPSGGALRLPRLAPARGGEQQPSLARPGASGTQRALSRGDKSGRRLAGGVGVADPAAAHHLERGGGTALAAVHEASAATWSVRASAGFR